MASQTGYGISLFVAGLLGVLVISQPVLSAMPYVPAVSSAGGQGQIVWPQNTINLSQLENIFAQNPGLSQFNIQFPNKSNWNVSPSSLTGILGNYQQEAQSLGVIGKLPDLSFSSLATPGLQGELPQISINPNADIKSQMDDVLRQLRYQELNLSDKLPDWLKNFIMAIYDAVYNAFEFIGPKLVGLLSR